MAPSTRRGSAALHAPLAGSTPATVDSPVFRFHDVDDTDRGFVRDDGNRHAIAPSELHAWDTPWTPDEHERFLHALEKFGCGQATSVATAWHAIAVAVGTRSEPDVRRHAGRYYAQLQAANAQRRKEYLAMQQIDARWTRLEDAQLERALAAQIPEGRASFPWAAIARRVPGKTPRDARERYHKLCYDVSRIEAGQHVMMHLSRQPRRADNQQEDPAQDHAAEAAIDCVVTLTPAETRILLDALEQVPVPSDAAPDVLAAVASGVAALACSKHRQPPRRAAPKFSMDDACRALERAIAAGLRDPLDTLELLAWELRLTPQREHERTTAATTATATTSWDHARLYTPSPSPSATFSFAFAGTAETLAPSSSLSTSFYLRSPVGSFDRDDTRAGEALLTHLKTSPVHNPRRSEHGRRREEYARGELDGPAGNSVFPLPTHAPSSFPYSLMPSTTTAAPAPTRYTGDDSDRRDHLFDHGDDDPMADYL